MKIVFVSNKFERTNLDLSTCDPEEIVMIVDVDRCISCGSCELACQIEHGESAGRPAPCRPIMIEQHNNAGNRRAVYLPLACRHCESPCDYYSQYNFWITCPSARIENKESVNCDFCVKRTETGLWPACATRCTMKTIYFGPAKNSLFILGEKRLREMGDVKLAG